jgi:hypothetical protein
MPLSAGVFLSAVQVIAQTTATPQAATLLAQSEAALTGSVKLNDVTLTGSVIRTAGGDDETGSVMYKAIADSNRLDLSFSSGTTTEIRSTTVNGVTGNWIDPKGVSAQHLLTRLPYFHQRVEHKLQFLRFRRKAAPFSSPSRLQWLLRVNSTNGTPL